MTAPEEFQAQFGPDTLSYLRPAQSILLGRLPDFSARSPTYPLFLIPATYLQSWRFLWLMQLSVSVLGLIAYISLIKKYMFPSDSSKALAMALFTWGPAQVVAWTGFVLPEGLMSSFLLMWIWLDSRQRNIHSMASIQFWGARLFDAAFLMLRPAFLMWPIAVYGYRLLAGIWRHEDPKLMARNIAILSWALVIVGSFCFLVSLITNHFEISYIGRSSQLGLVLNHGNLSFDNVCRQNPCSAVTKEALGIISTAGNQFELYHSHSTTLSANRVVETLSKRHGGLSRDAILDQMLSDLSPLAREGRVRHSIDQFGRNLTTVPSSPRLIPEYGEIYGLWSAACGLWGRIIAIGIIGLVLRPKSVTQNPLMKTALAIWIYSAVVSSGFAYVGHSRLMAPVYTMFSLLGLSGLLVLGDSVRSLILRCFRHQVV